MSLFEQQDEWFFSRLAKDKPSNLFGGDSVVVEELSPGMRTLDEEWQRAKEWADGFFRERGEQPSEEGLGRAIARRMGEMLSAPAQVVAGTTSTALNTLIPQLTQFETLLQDVASVDSPEAERARVTQAAIDVGFISRRPGDGGDGIAISNGEGSAYETLMQAEFAADRLEAEIRRIKEAYESVGEPVELDGLDGDLSSLREQIGEFKSLLATIASKTGTFDVRDLQRLVMQMKTTANNADGKIRAADAALMTNIGDIHNQLYEDAYAARIKAASSQQAAESLLRDFVSARYAGLYGQRNVDAALDALRSSGVLSQDDFVRRHPRAAARLSGDAAADIHRGGPAAEREIARPLERRREAERAHPEEVRITRSELIGLGRYLKGLDADIAELYRGIRGRSYESENGEYFAVLPPLHTKELLRLMEEYGKLPETATEARKALRESIAERLRLAGEEIAQAERAKQIALGMSEEEIALTAPGGEFAHPRTRNAELQRLIIKKAEGGGLTPEETTRYDALRKATIVASALAAEQIVNSVNLALSQGRGQDNPVLKQYYSGTPAERLTALQTLLRSQGNAELAERLSDPATQAVYMRAFQDATAEIHRRSIEGEVLSEAQKRQIQDQAIQRTKEAEYIGEALKGDKFFEQSAKLLRQSSERLKSTEGFVTEVLNNPGEYDPRLVEALRQYQQISPVFSANAQRLIADLQLTDPSRGLSVDAFLSRFKQDMDTRAMQTGFELKTGVLAHLKLTQPEQYKLIADYIRSQGLDPDKMTPAQMAGLKFNPDATQTNEATLAALRSYNATLVQAGKVSSIVEAFTIDRERGGAVFNYINRLPNIEDRMKALTEMGALDGSDPRQQALARSVLSLPADRQREILENLSMRDQQYQGGTVDHSADRRYGAALLQMATLPPEMLEQLKRNGMDFNDPDRARLRKQILERYDEIARLTHDAAVAREQGLKAAYEGLPPSLLIGRERRDAPRDEFIVEDPLSSEALGRKAAFKTQEINAGKYLQDIQLHARAGTSEIRDGARAHFITLEQIRIGNADRTLTEEQKLERATRAVDKVMRELEASGATSITAEAMAEKLKAADAAVTASSLPELPPAHGEWIRQRVKGNAADVQAMLAQARIPPMPSLISAAIASGEAIATARASGLGVARPPLDVAQAEQLAGAAALKVEALKPAAERQIAELARMMKLSEADVVKFREAIDKASSRGDLSVLDPYRARLMREIEADTGRMLAATGLASADRAALGNPAANDIARNLLANELIGSTVEVNRELLAARAEQQGRAAQLAVQRDPSLLALAARPDADVAEGPARVARGKVVESAREQSIRDRLPEIARAEPALTEAQRRHAAEVAVDKDMAALRARHEGKVAVETLEREPAKLALAARSDDSFVGADRAAQLKARDDARELVMKAREEQIHRRAEQIARSEPGLERAEQMRRAAAHVDRELAERVAKAQAPAGTTPDLAMQLKAQEQLTEIIRETAKRQPGKYQAPAESGPELHARSEVLQRLARPRPEDMARAEAALKRLQERPEDFSRFAEPDKRAPESDLVLARQLASRRAILAESGRGRGDPDYFQRLAHAGSEASEQLARGLRERVAGREALVELARRPELAHLATVDQSKLQGDRLAEVQRAERIMKAAEHERELMTRAKMAEIEAAPGLQLSKEQVKVAASRAVDAEISRMAAMAGSGTTGISIAGNVRGTTYASLNVGMPANDALGRSAEELAKEEERRKEAKKREEARARAEQEERAKNMDEKAKEVAQVVARETGPDKKPGDQGRTVTPTPGVARVTEPRVAAAEPRLVAAPVMPRAPVGGAVHGHVVDLKSAAPARPTLIEGGGRFPPEVRDKVAALPVMDRLPVDRIPPADAARDKVAAHTPGKIPGAPGHSVG